MQLHWSGGTVTEHQVTRTVHTWKQVTGMTAVWERVQDWKAEVGPPATWRRS